MRSFSLSYTGANTFPEDEKKFTMHSWVRKRGEPIRKFRIAAATG
jgi:hypothetical protein